MLGHVQLHAEHLAQVDPPGVEHLRVSEGATADRAAAGQPIAGVVPRRQEVEHDVVHLIYTLKDFIPYKKIGLYQEKGEKLLLK